MTKVLIALCIVLAVQISSAYEVAVPIFKQRYGAKDATRIISGKTAAKGQFPYQAAITIDGAGFCGGSLISPDFVLTAAHCANHYRTWAVTLGAQNIREVSEPGRITLTSRKGIPHENFDTINFENDVAVIQLPEKVALNEQINVISLPPLSYQNEDFSGETARVSGWGRTSDYSSAISPTLQYVDLTIMTFEDCLDVYGPEIVVHTKYCCSGAEKKGTCNGDSGGSLTIGSGGNLSNIGIVSFGSSLGCALGFPTGFTATTYFVDWISSKTGIPIRD